MFNLLMPIDLTTMLQRFYNLRKSHNIFGNTPGILY